MAPNRDYFLSASRRAIWDGCVVRVRHTLMLLAFSVTIASCDEKKPENNYVLKEVIDVQGNCWEDHVGQHDSSLVKLFGGRQRTLERFPRTGSYLKKGIGLNIFLMR
jgi:hypothetical protein